MAHGVSLPLGEGYGGGRGRETGSRNPRVSRPQRHDRATRGKGTGVNVREFLALVEARLPQALPPGYRGYTSRIAFGFVQAHYGDPRVHYECWVQRKTGLLEIGLHFEGHREFSYGWAAALAERMDDVMDGLTPAVELEEWTERWTRLHERWPAPQLDEALAARAAARLADYIVVLQPIVEALAPQFAALAPPANAASPRTPRRVRGRAPGV